MIKTIETVRKQTSHHSWWKKGRNHSKLQIQRWNQFSETDSMVRNHIAKINTWKSFDKKTCKIRVSNNCRLVNTNVDTSDFIKITQISDNSNLCWCHCIPRLLTKLTQKFITIIISILLLLLMFLLYDHCSTECHSLFPYDILDRFHMSQKGSHV